MGRGEDLEGRTQKIRRGESQGQARGTFQGVQTVTMSSEILCLKVRGGYYSLVIINDS